MKTAYVLLFNCVVSVLITACILAFIMIRVDILGPLLPIAVTQYTYAHGLSALCVSYVCIMTSAYIKGISHQLSMSSAVLYVISAVGVMLALFASMYWFLVFLAYTLYTPLQILFTTPLFK